MASLTAFEGAASSIGAVGVRRAWTETIALQMTPSLPQEVLPELPAQPVDAPVLGDLGNLVMLLGGRLRGARRRSSSNGECVLL